MRARIKLADGHALGEAIEGEGIGFVAGSAFVVNGQVPIQFETEPPLVACSVAGNMLWPPNHHFVDVGLSASSSEGNLQVQVFSDEPQGGAAPDAVLTGGTLQLRAKRTGNLDGRVYLIVVTSVDGCGNVGVCCTTVVVPKNMSPGSHQCR